MLIAAILLSLALVGAPAAAAAEASRPGPRIAAIELIDPAKWLREPESSVALTIVDPESGLEKRLLRGRLDARKRVVPVPFEAPSWSPDGKLIAFSAHDGPARRDRIYLVSPDGTGLQPVPGTANGRNPVLAPDRQTLAFSRSRYRIRVAPGFVKDPASFVIDNPNVDPIRTYYSTTTWIVDLAGGKPRRLTRWRNGLANTPTSFSPDGSGLLLNKDDDNLPWARVVRLGLANGSIQELVRRAQEAVYSPDGSRIAFAGYLNRDLVQAEENRDYLASELYVANADGSGIRRLSRSKGVLESAPSWDPSGARLAYVQFRGDTGWLAGVANLYPLGNALMQINADGTCRTKILTRPAVGFYGTAWQPGPGREAGPISC